MTLSSELARPALAAGISYGNIAVALPLLILARGGSVSLAGSLIGLHTIAFAVGALIAHPLRRAESGVGIGLAAVASGNALLVFAPSVGMLALGAVTNGAGMGLFWVGAQTWLGRHAGSSGSEKAFVEQYALYVLGTMVGAALTGLVIAMARRLDVTDELSIEVTFLVGATPAILVLPRVRAWLAAMPPSGRERPPLKPMFGLSLQSPNLLLVAALGMLSSLAPVVLSDTYSVSPLAIGIAWGCISAGKIGGSLVAGACVTWLGSRVTVAGMLAASAFTTVLLAATNHVLAFTVLTVAVTFFGIGVWPIVIDGALARVSPPDRAGLTVVWNVREYAIIAAATASGGFLLDATSGPTLMLAMVAALLLSAAISALAVLRAPIYSPCTA